MNIFLVALIMSVFWIIFSQVNELKSANEGCCKTKTCGTSGFDHTLWATSLTLAIGFTLFLIFKGYMLYKSRRLNTLNTAKNTLGELGTEMMFG